MHSETGNLPDFDIVAYHGWGFNSAFWQKWEQLLPEKVVFKTADRGYFLEEKHPEFSSHSIHKILLLHSFGLHWCPEEIMKEATCIVIFNGFKNFHPEEPQDNKRSKAILKKMISEFGRNPEKVLNAFWENSFYPDIKRNTPGFTFDKKLLLKDLNELNVSSFDVQQLKNSKPIICLDGGSDKILQNPRGKTFTELTEGNAVYHFIKEAGHGLPVTHFEDCWSFINAMIPIFRHDGNYRRR